MSMNDKNDNLEELIANAVRSTGYVTNSDKWDVAEAVLKVLPAQQPAARDDGIQLGNEGIDIGTWTPPGEPERPTLPGHEHEMNKRRDWKESA